MTKTRFRLPWYHTFSMSACSAALCILAAAAPAAAQDSATLKKQISETSAFDHFVKGGGVITYLILLPLSMLTVGLCVEHLVHIRRGALMPDQLKITLAELLQEKRYKEILELTSTDRSLLGGVIHAGLSQASNGLPAMLRSMEEVMESKAASLFRRIEYLNIIGNISPMIGLFGTVYGMIKTFSTIVEMGGAPDPAALASGISVALVTTFWGLLVAIPALSVFHLIRNRIDGLLAQCAVEAEEMIQIFKPLGRGTLMPVKESAGSRPAPAAKGTPVAGAQASKA